MISNKIWISYKKLLLKYIKEWNIYISNNLIDTILKNITN